MSNDPDRARMERELATMRFSPQRRRSPHRTGHAMDTFTQQMLETALWSSNDESTPSGGEPMDKNYSIEDFDPQSRTCLTREAKAFQQANAHDLAIFGDDSKAGHYYWLDRNGHGSGFEDDDYKVQPELSAALKRLKKASQADGETNLYIGDDGRIYASGCENGSPVKKRRAKKRRIGKGQRRPGLRSSPRASRAGKHRTIWASKTYQVAVYAWPRTLGFQVWVAGRHVHSCPGSVDCITFAKKIETALRHQMSVGEAIRWAEKETGTRQFVPGTLVHSNSPGRSSKVLIKEIRPHVRLYHDLKTGIAWVEDGTSGTGHSAHPNIHGSGSAAGMKKKGFWLKSDRVVRSHGMLYNIDQCSVRSPLDKIAAEYCHCGGACSEGGCSGQSSPHRHQRHHQPNALGSLVHKAATKVARIFKGKGR
jgi:hypothetical protein